MHIEISNAVRSVDLVLSQILIHDEHNCEIPQINEMIFCIPIVACLVYMVIDIKGEGVEISTVKSRRI